MAKEKAKKASHFRERKGYSTDMGDIVTGYTDGLRNFGQTNIESVQNLGIEHIDLSSNAFLATQMSKKTFNPYNKKSFSTISPMARRRTTMRMEGTIDSSQFELMKKDMLNRITSQLNVKGKISAHKRSSSVMKTSSPKSNR